MGLWTPSAVREVLTNPKSTGFTVWNRRATKDTRHPGKNNRKDQWAMSPVPAHEALVEVETFVAAQALMTRRAPEPGSHPPGFFRVSSNYLRRISQRCRIVS